MSPGKAVRELRLSSGMTQRELSERTGLTQSAISAIEHGDEPLGLGRAVRIAEALGVHHRDILERPTVVVGERVPVDRWSSQRTNVFIEALIEKTPGVVGGSACITRTRIPVWTLENYRRLGATTQQILEAFPTLRAADVIAAWAYSAVNIEEVARDIAENA